MLSSKQTPKPVRMRDENCSPLNIVSDCSRIKAIRSTAIQRFKSPGNGRTLPSRTSRVFNEFRGRAEYLRTTAVPENRRRAPFPHSNARQNRPCGDITLRPPFSARTRRPKNHSQYLHE